MKTLRLWATIAVMLALTACSGAKPAATAPASVGMRPAPASASAANFTGLGAVMGKDARSAGALFGAPRLDIKDGAGRKLQFSNQACVLDIYYYALRAGAEPVATHVDARTPDGRDVDRAACADALKRR